MPNAGSWWKRSINCRPKRPSVSDSRRSWGKPVRGATVSQVARRFHLPETTVRAIDLRYLER